MIYSKLSMPETSSGWAFIIILLIVVIFISIWFDNRYFKRKHKDRNTHQLEKESAISHSDNEEIFKKIDDITNTSSIVKITYHNDVPKIIEKTEMFTTKEGHLDDDEISKRKQKLQKEVLEGVVEFDHVEKVTSNYHRDGDILVGQAYMKQSLKENTTRVTLIGLTPPFSKDEIYKKLVRDGYEKG